MTQRIGLVSLVVDDYDDALAFFVGKLGFTLIEDRFVPEQSKRWVVVAPPGAFESRILLAKAATEDQKSRVGSQTGGRVFLFLYTDDFWRDLLDPRDDRLAHTKAPGSAPPWPPHSSSRSSGTAATSDVAADDPVETVAFKILLAWKGNLRPGSNLKFETAIGPGSCGMSIDPEMKFLVTAPAKQLRGRDVWKSGWELCESK